MCGIAGIINTKGPVVEESLHFASNCLSHRGPEGEGIWLNPDKTVGLIHRRLKIIDLSEKAAQPMSYLDRYRIIHNGELYNYIEIREKLLQKGYHFSSASDTEVIVAAYAAWGSQCLQQFDGMFAFAIWDEKEKKLFAARDRFGEKPFFFFYDDTGFVFASEIKALWDLGIKKEVNSSMLYNFLSIGYTTNPSDPQETFYKDIHKLPAASFIEYAINSNQLSVQKYWIVYPKVNEEIREEEALEQFGQLFNESIKKRLRSDVPVGTSLSGGLDSSSIVACCNRMPSHQYSHKCFTAHFEGFEKDELSFAGTVAGRFGLEHYITEIHEDEVPGLMKKVMHFQDEPFSSASVLAQYKVFELAKKQGISVLLDGQGADEVLAGYHHYYKWYWRELYRKRKLKSSGELKKAREITASGSFSLSNKLASILPEFTAGILQSRKAKQAFRDPDLDPDFAYAHKRELYYSTPASFDLNGALYFNTFVNGLEELLRLADRNSMAHAVEVRLPFLDHTLVEFLFSLPSSFKIHEGWTKWLLRKSMEGNLPGEITWRRDKVGFEPPQKKWMENSRVQEAIMTGKKELVTRHVLRSSVTEKIKPHSAYAALGRDWKYWAASFLFD